MAGTEVEPREVVEIVQPATGELVDVRQATTDVLAQHMDMLRSFELDIRSAKRVLADEVLRRCDQEGIYSVTVGDLKLTADGPGRVEYDGAVLFEMLTEFVVNGTITAEAAERAVQTIVEHKPRAVGINALKKQGGDIAAAIELASRPSERPRGVRVTPA